MKANSKNIFLEDDHFSYKKPLSKWVLRKMNNKIKYKICKNLKRYTHIRESTQYYCRASIPVRSFSASTFCSHLFTRDKRAAKFFVREGLVHKKTETSFVQGCVVGGCVLIGCKAGSTLSQVKVHKALTFKRKIITSY